MNETKEYLNRLWAVRKSVSRLQDKVLEAQSRSEKITQTLSDMPRGGGDIYHGELWASLVDMKNAYADALAEEIKTQLEIEDFIRTVPGDMNRLVLHLRYSDCLPWEKICIAMGYCWKQTHSHHKKALKAAHDKRMEELGHEKTQL